MSRLIKEVREKRGWAYHIGSGVTHFLDVGDVSIGAGLPKDKLDDAVGLITEICYGLGGANNWKITSDEIEIAKDTFRGRFALTLDKPENVLGMALDNLMFEGEIKTPKEILDNIEKVSLKDVQKVCDLIFKPENLSISVVGDYKKLNF